MYLILTDKTRERISGRSRRDVHYSDDKTRKRINILQNQYLKMRHVLTLKWRYVQHSTKVVVSGVDPESERRGRILKI